MYDVNVYQGVAYIRELQPNGVHREVASGPASRADRMRELVALANAELKREEESKKFFQSLKSRKSAYLHSSP